MQTHVYDEVIRNGNKIKGTWKNNQLHGLVIIEYHDGAYFEYKIVYLEGLTSLEFEFRGFSSFQMAISTKENSKLISSVAMEY